MQSFINRPGSSRSSFNAVPFEKNWQEYRTSQHYIQSLLRECPDDVHRVLSVPEGEDRNNWIYANFRQFLIELNYYAFAHHEVSTAATHPKMEFSINGQNVRCLSAATNPPKEVPAIDYITQTLDQATLCSLDANLFPSGMMTQAGMQQIPIFMRRLYRIFSYSFVCHRELFESLESQSHLCERFTQFARDFGLMKSEDIHIPDEYWSSRNSGSPAASNVSPASSSAPTVTVSEPTASESAHPPEPSAADRGSVPTASDPPKPQ